MVTLGLNPNKRPTNTQVRRRYKMLMLKYHPDKNVNASDKLMRENKAKCSEINDACQILFKSIATYRATVKNVSRKMATTSDHGNEQSKSSDYISGPVEESTNEIEIPLINDIINSNGKRSIKSVKPSAKRRRPNTRSNSGSKMPKGNLNDKMIEKIAEQV